MLRCLTAGESHGKCLVAILDGMIAGLRVRPEDIDKQLARRQEGYGRGGRMKIEKDKVQILSGLRKGITIGSPIALKIDNRDFSIDRLSAVTRPRPGHADLAGGIKYNTKDLRDVLERASARETAARVAAGSICTALLKSFGISVSSRIVMIGGRTEKKLMLERIRLAEKRADTLGGIVEVVAFGLPAGLGSCAQFDRKLNGRLAGALMSIQAVKGVETGLGFGYAKLFGSQAHDEIFYGAKKKICRGSNNAGGIEGGMTNGQPVVLRICMKPISTIGRPLASVDIRIKKAARAAVERHDTCAVSACGVVAEAVTAFELADAFLEKFGGDSLTETRRNYEGYVRQAREY